MSDDDTILIAEVGGATLMVTPLAHRTYREAGAQGLGGSDGLFICLHDAAGFEVLAKAIDANAAETIFRALVAYYERGAT